MKLHQLIAWMTVLALLWGAWPLLVAADTDHHPLKNGDFEHGTLTGWQAADTVSPFSGAAYTGDYGCLLVGDGGWDDLLTQTISVVPGCSYTLTFWYQTKTVGVSWYLFDGDIGTRLCRGWLNAAEWTQVTHVFTPSCDTASLVYRSSGSHMEERVFLDCVQVTVNPCTTHVYDTPCDPTCNVCDQVRDAMAHVYSYRCDTVCDACGAVRSTDNQHTFRFPCATQCYYCDATRITTIPHTYDAPCDTRCLFCSEVREEAHTYDNIYDADCNQCGHIRVPAPQPAERLTAGGTAISYDVDGIAFRFYLEGQGAVCTDNNAYVSESAVVYPYRNSDGYRLVRMGAVMSNETNATLDLEHLTQRTLDVQATYLCNATTDSVAYAVRILRIPESERDTVISARPYYVYTDGETETVVYGDVVTRTYNQLDAPL